MPQNGAAPYWPQKAWKKSTAEDQGIDSLLLAQGFETLAKRLPNLHRLIILRHGQVVFDRIHMESRRDLRIRLLSGLLSLYARIRIAPRIAFQDKDGKRWNLRSITPSVVSILTGIALNAGLLTGLDQSLGELLPEEFGSDIDPIKARITLRHLLTMTSGLPPIENATSQFDLLNSRNWVHHLLSLPQLFPAGSQFIYSSANAHLLSAALTHACGKSLLGLATQKLFLPLGIGEIEWGTDPKNIPFGGGNLLLSPEDIVRIGYLYLRGGQWEGNQIVPAAWVEESLHPAAGADSGFGYLWRLHDVFNERSGVLLPTFAAGGEGGQVLLVIPDLDLIMLSVARSCWRSEQNEVIDEMVSRYLIPAVRETDAQ